jgi:hypothetical protein
MTSRNRITSEKQPIKIANSVIVHRRGAENAERMNIFLSADPGGIGFAFYRAEEGRKKNLTY